MEIKKSEIEEKNTSLQLFIHIFRHFDVEIQPLGKKVAFTKFFLQSVGVNLCNFHNFEFHITMPQCGKFRILL